VDLRGETRFAGTAGAAGSGGIPTAAGTTGLPAAGLLGAIEGSGGGTLVAITPGPPGAVGGGATLPAGTTGLPGAGGGAILAARRTTRMPAPRTPGDVGGAGGTLVAGITGLLAAAPAGAVDGSAALAPRIGLPGAGALGATEGAGGNIGAGTTGSLAAGPYGAVEGDGAILVARTLGLRAARPPGALEGAGVTVAAATTGLSGAGPPGDGEGGGGGIMAAGNIGLADAKGGGGGINAVASTAGSSGAGPAGGTGPFRRRFGISAGFSTGGSTLALAPGFGLCAVSSRRRFSREAAARGVFAFPALGAGLVASFWDDWLASGPPSRGTPRGSSRIHLPAPLLPSVRMKSFFSRRCKSSITQRFEKPVRTASTCISIWRLAATVDSGLGAGINWINTLYRAASAAGMAPKRNSRLISDMRFRLLGS
jgi:hypothetical protein